MTLLFQEFSKGSHLLSIFWIFISQGKGFIPFLKKNYVKIKLYQPVLFIQVPLLAASFDIKIGSY